MTDQETSTLAMGNSEAEVDLVSDPKPEGEPEGTEGKQGATEQTGAPAPGTETPEAFSAEFVAQYPDLAAKYKNQTELGKALKEAQKFISSRHGEEAKAPEPEMEETDAREFFDRFVENPMKTVQELVLPRLEQAVQDRITVTLLTRDAWNSVVAKYPDANQYDADMGKMTPAIAQMVATGVPLETAMERALLLVKGGSPAPSEKEIRAQAREDARKQLRATTVERGNTGGTPPAAPSLQERVADEILRSDKPTLTLRRL